MRQKHLRHSAHIFGQNVIASVNGGVGFCGPNPLHQGTGGSPQGNVCVFTRGPAQIYDVTAEPLGDGDLFNLFDHAMQLIKFENRGERIQRFGDVVGGKHRDFCFPVGVSQRNSAHKPVTLRLG